MPGLSDNPRCDESKSPAPSLDRLAPWLVSLGVHLLVILVMASAAMIVVQRRLPEELIVPEATWEHRAAGQVRPREPEFSSHAQLRPVPARPEPRYPEPPAPRPRSDSLPPLLGPLNHRPPAAALASFGLRSAGSVPRTSFFGAGGNAHHVVYVIDRSGSMVLAFDDVRREALLSIGRLQPSQDFHVILFAEGRAIELPDRRLIPPTRRNKLRAAEFLQAATLGPGTTVLPALERAFEVLGEADARRPGKLIYLLTDGEFKPSAGESSVYRLADGREVDGNEAVVAWLRDHNRAREVHVNTYLYQYDSLTSPNPQSDRRRPADVMKRIANENGGRFRLIRLYD